MSEAAELLHRLSEEHTLAKKEYRLLIESRSRETENTARELADKARREVYGTDVYIRGLIEVGSYCRNDCLYCGIRKSNTRAQRYRLTAEEILSCCAEGYTLGFRTFVLQGGEGIFPTAEAVELVSEIRRTYPECAITLSLGEMEREDYQRLHDAGADRYLLRHETADKAHYEKLHPQTMSFEHRLQCLRDLKDLGYQAGCGFMVGSPFQTTETLAEDLKFIETFSPHMCGIGPFIPASNTPFCKLEAGSCDLTVYLLSLIRLIKPNILLPATTALGTLEKGGRERGIKAGANVVMPNLSPFSQRSKYSIYDNKLSGAEEAAENLQMLSDTIQLTGYHIVKSRGDMKTHTI